MFVSKMSEDMLSSQLSNSLQAPPELADEGLQWTKREVHPEVPDSSESGTDTEGDDGSGSESDSETEPNRAPQKQSNLHTHGPPSIAAKRQDSGAQSQPTTDRDLRIHSVL